MSSGRLSYQNRQGLRSVNINQHVSTSLPRGSRVRTSLAACALPRSPTRLRYLHLRHACREITETLPWVPEWYVPLLSSVLYRRESLINDILGAQLTWTVPAEPASHHSIAFAPNVTPVTFNDPPRGADATSEPSLFPTNASECSPRRSTHSRKRGEDHIPRPPNAFILFRSSFIKSQHVSSEVETNHSTLSKIIGLTWQNMPHEERQIWHAKAKKALEEHRKKWPQYAFRPSHSKAKGSAEKRKVREVEPKDLKRCAKIAELLVEGKKGAELDAAIQEFDRTHVPEIVTRFETPITARSFRRSSSAPIDDDKLKQPFLMPSSPPSRRLRSTSSQPSFDLPDCKTANSIESHEPHQASNPLVVSHSSPDLSTSSSLDASLSYSFPPKPQPSYVSCLISR